MTGLRFEGLPLFPLQSVLLPGMPLALHVFEPRYRALVDDVTRQGIGFGVVLITHGSEVGGEDQRSDVGVMADVRRLEELPDGRWLLDAEGGDRFRVDRWLDDDPYPRADVEMWPQPLGSGGSEAVDRARRPFDTFLAVAAELGADTGAITLDDDPGAALYEMAALVPISTYDRYRLLSSESVADGAPMLADAIAGVVEILRHRMGEL